MKLKTLLAVAMVVSLGWVTSANAGVTDIYLSFSDFGDGGAIDNTTEKFLVGDTGSVFVWVDQNYQIDTGAFLDALNDDTGVVNFTSAVVFNPEVVIVPDTPFTVRWQSTGNGTPSDGLIDEFNGFKVTVGTGILPQNSQGAPFLDLGYDPTSSAFLFARLDFNVVGEGSANLTLQTGDGLVVDGGISLDPNYGGVIVEANSIPEPTSAALLALGLIGLVSRRRR